MMLKHSLLINIKEKISENKNKNKIWKIFKIYENLLSSEILILLEDKKSEMIWGIIKVKIIIIFFFSEEEKIMKSRKKRKKIWGEEKNGRLFVKGGERERKRGSMTTGGCWDRQGWGEL